MKTEGRRQNKACSILPSAFNFCLLILAFSLHHFDWLSFTTLGTFGRVIVDLDDEATTFLAGLGQRPFPTRPVTFRVIGAAKEDTPASGTLLDEIAAIFGTGHPYFD